MIGFIIVARHDISADLQINLEHYLDISARYIIAAETEKGVHAQTQGQHFHIVADMTDKEYDSFRKTYLVKKLKLSGQARNQRSREYGRIRNIRDETKLINYTVKNNNIIYKNIDLKTIQQHISDSYISKKPKEFVTEIMQYLQAIDHYIGSDGNATTTPTFDTQSVEKSILAYYIENDIGKPLSRQTIKSLTTKYMMYFHKPPPCEYLGDFRQKIYNYIFFT